MTGLPMLQTWTLGVALSLLATGARADELETIVERSRAASARPAWSELDAGIACKGTTTSNAVETRFELLFAKGGAYRMATKGPLAQTSGCDGSKSWVRELGLPPRNLVGREAAVANAAQWVHSGRWCEPDASVSLELVAVRDDGIEISMMLDGIVRPATLTLDPKSALPRTLVLGTAAREAVFEFDDYRSIAGIPIAHRVARQQGGVKGLLVVESGAAATPRAVATCSPALDTAPAGTRFEPDIDAEIEIRRVPSGHLIVRPRLNGADHGWFILDTGAGQLCISPGIADGLEMEKFGEVPAIGVSGSVVASFRRGARFELGPIAIDDPVYVELDLSFLEPIFGVAVAGICGYDLFARTIVELELEGPRAWIHDPAKFELEKGKWVELGLEDRIPSIHASFEGDRDGWFKIDTGDAGAVTFNSPTVNALSLLEGREVSQGMMGGVGGSRAVSIGTLEWFELGGRRFEAVQATFSQGDAGTASEASVHGTIGSHLLAPFRVVFDYPSSRIALVPLE